MGPHGLVLGCSRSWMELGLKIEEGIGLQVESGKGDGNRGVLVWFESE